MSVIINGDTGVTTPGVVSDSYTGPISVSSSAPDNSVVVNSSGNLGFGVTPSAWSVGKAFEVGATGNGIWGVNSASVYFTQNAYYNGGWKYANSSTATNYQQNGGQHIWQTAPSGTAGNAISFTQAMTLTAAGQHQTLTTNGTLMNAYGCRAWVNFNGTGTVAIRASGNVSSITDNGVGNYTANFTTAMPDANYAIGGMVPQNGNGGNICIAALNTGSAQVTTHSTDYNTPKDMSIVCIDIFR